MATAPARMILKWSVPPGEARPVASFLQGLMVVTREEPGCLSCALSTDVGGRAIVRYVEEWATEDDLKRQLRSERFAMLAELMEHATEPPTIEFELAGARRGADYAEEVRGGDGEN